MVGKSNNPVPRRTSRDGPGNLRYFAMAITIPSSITIAAMARWLRISMRIDGWPVSIGSLYACCLPVPPSTCRTLPEPLFHTESRESSPAYFIMRCRGANGPDFCREWRGRRNFMRRSQVTPHAAKQKFAWVQNPNRNLTRSRSAIHFLRISGEQNVAVAFCRQRCGSIAAVDVFAEIKIRRTLGAPKCRWQKRACSSVG